MRNGALPFIPSIFIVFTSKVGLLVARLRLSGIKFRLGTCKKCCFPFRSSGRFSACLCRLVEVCGSTAIRSLLEFTSLDGAFVSSPVVFACSMMFFVSSIVSPVGLLDSIQLLD